ncbi:unnamed protein product, partial [Urochloa humidicola]
SSVHNFIYVPTISDFVYRAIATGEKLPTTGTLALLSVDMSQLSPQVFA